MHQLLLLMSVFLLLQVGASGRSLPLARTRASRVAAAQAHKREVPSAWRVQRALREGGSNVTQGIVSVTDYGAVGDNATENTAAFTAALACFAGAGGVVWVPPGAYRIAGSLDVPVGVSLVGSFTVVPSSSHALDTGGSVLMPTGGRGDASGTPFLTVHKDAAVRGFSIWHVEQAVDVTPVPYPWALQLSGDNAAVMDVELLNAYLGINATLAGRHYIARVQGQPLLVGIFVDQTYDIGRIEDVHWNPWWSDAKPIVDFQNVFGTGFKIARTDWEYVLNTFVFGMAVGYDFVSSAEGSCNGNFVGIGADCCANASVRVQAADPWGILITNGEFTSFSGGFGPDTADHTQIVVTATNAGAVRISNSAFWGPSNQIALIDGAPGSSVGFSGCLFNYWDHAKQNRSAIQVTGPVDLQVQDSNFQFPPPAAGTARAHVSMGPGSGKAIITGNLVAGPLVVIDGGAKKIVMAANADDDWA